MPDTAPDAGERVIRALIERGLTIAVAESLTGGLLVAELIRTPGASATVLGGVVAYDTRLKHSLLGVDADLLAAQGPVHAEVAAQMASGVRERLAVDGGWADVGVATTGVAGPEAQHGNVPGTVYLGYAIGDRVESELMRLQGSRADIRSATVTAALTGLLRRLERTGE